MAFTSILSPYFPRYESIERPYDRPLSPTTRQFFDKNVFYPSNKPDQFQDVFSSDRCLRCYSKNHEGKNCPIFNNPTPKICPYCRFLYHDRQECIYKKCHTFANDRPTDNNVYRNCLYCHASLHNKPDCDGCYFQCYDCRILDTQ